MALSQHLTSCPFTNNILILQCISLLLLAVFTLLHLVMHYQTYQETIKGLSNEWENKTSNFHIEERNLLFSFLCS